jgi:hypothetical protein
VGQDRQDWPGHSSAQRASVREAAELLGTTVDAIRKRVQRDTIPYEKASDGRVWILLDAVQDSTGHRQDTGRSQSDSSALMPELVEELRRTNELLREVISTRDEEIRRRDTIIMNMTEAMKALNPPAQEAPSEAQESDVSPDPTDELEEVREERDTERTRRETAESTLHEGMAEERRRREEAERERDDLRRELHAFREPRESPEAAEEQQGRGEEPHPATVEAQEGAQRRPWWRRIIGG